MKRFVPMALAMIAIAGNSAAASVSAHLELRDLQFDVVDLYPLDNQSPSYTLLSPTSSSTQVSSEVKYTFPTLKTTKGFLAELSDETKEPRGNAQVHVGANGFDISVAAMKPGADVEATAETTGGSPTQGFIRVAPRTALYAQFTVTLSSDSQCWGGLQPDGSAAACFARGGATASFTGVDGFGGVSNTVSFDTQDGQRVESRKGGAWFTNAGDDYKDVYFFLAARVEAGSVLSPVPEPASCLMAAAGLLTLGLTRRSRKAGRQA